MGPGAMAGLSLAATVPRWQRCGHALRPSLATPGNGWRCRKTRALGQEHQRVCACKPARCACGVGPIDAQWCKQGPSGGPATATMTATGLRPRSSSGPGSPRARRPHRAIGRQGTPAPAHATEPIHASSAGSVAAGGIRRLRIEHALASTRVSVSGQQHLGVSRASRSRLSAQLHPKRRACQSRSALPRTPANPSVARASRRSSADAVTRAPAIASRRSAQRWCIWTGPLLRREPPAGRRTQCASSRAQRCLPHSKPLANTASLRRRNAQ